MAPPPPPRGWGPGYGWDGNNGRGNLLPTATATDAAATVAPPPSPGWDGATDAAATVAPPPREGEGSREDDHDATYGREGGKEPPGWDGNDDECNSHGIGSSGLPNAGAADVTSPRCFFARLLWVGNMGR